MAISSSQLKLYLTGGLGNTNPALSLGGATSTTLFVSYVLNNLFLDAYAQEAWDGSVKYRALAFKNNSGLTAFGAYAFIYSETTSGDTVIDIAFDGGIQTIADEDTAPSQPALTFVHPLSGAGGLALGDVPAGGEARVWYRRTVTAGASATSLDTGAVRFVVSSV